MPSWAVQLIVGVVFVALPIVLVTWWFLLEASSR
jgi:hypothetical protein